MTQHLDSHSAGNPPDNDRKSSVSKHKVSPIFQDSLHIIASRFGPTCEEYFDYVQKSTKKVIG
jgi:hypothetical protein